MRVATSCFLLERLALSLTGTGHAVFPQVWRSWRFEMELVHRQAVVDMCVDAKVNSGQIRKGRHFKRGSVSSQASPHLGAVLL